MDINKEKNNKEHIFFQNRIKALANTINERLL